MARKRVNRIMRLWQRSPRCRWCGCLTVLIFRPSKQPGQRLPNIGYPYCEATLDHLYSRLDGRRGHVTDGTEVTVLACRQCNHQRGALEVAQRPLEELRREAAKGYEERDQRL